MSTLRKLTWMELKLFMREPITVIFTLALPLIILFVLGQAFGNTPDPEGDVFRGAGPMDYYTPAYIALVMASIGLIALPVHLAAYREKGVLRRLRASSVSVWTIFGSHLLVSFAIALVSAVILGIASWLAYDIDFPASFGLLIPAFIVGVLTFTAVGVFLGAVLPTARAAQGVGLLLFFLMMFISGAAPPPEVLGQPLVGMGEATPLKHAIILIQDPWLDLGWNNAALGILVAFMGVAAIASARFFRWE